VHQPADREAAVGSRRIRKERESAWLAALLAWVAGAVDAVGFLTLVHLFTAHMSGNSVGMGAYLGDGHWQEAVRRGIPIPLFVLGVVAGAAVATALARRGFRPFFAPVLALEAVLLATFLLWGGAVLRGGKIHVESGGAYVLVVALPAIAMGLQNATLRRVGGLSVRTTFITGILTTLAEEGVAWLYWLGGHLRAGRGRRVWRVAHRHVSLVRMGLLAGLWCAYAFGAVAGGFGVERWGMGALWPPLAVLAAVILADLRSPIEPRLP
jgi:uncharacterized membrane protein YoaK (UPF0700 family)